MVTVPLLIAAPMIANQTIAIPMCDGRPTLNVKAERAAARAAGTNNMPMLHIPRIATLQIKPLPAKTKRGRHRRVPIQQAIPATAASEIHIRGTKGAAETGRRSTVVAAAPIARMAVSAPSHSDALAVPLIRLY